MLNSIKSKVSNCQSCAERKQTLSAHRSKITRTDIDVLLVILFGVVLIEAHRRGNV